MTPHAPNNVFLAGFMGAGKSTVGPCLARLLGWAFVDSDDEIVKRLGRPIAEVFRDQDEAFFRAEEAKVIADLAARRGQVVALGGGALLAEKNRDVITRSGALVYLKASIETLAGRLVGSDRPLLQGETPLAEKIASLLEARAHLYESASCIETVDEGAPEVIAQRIATRLGLCAK
jgi:shikimate kinase